MRCLEGEFEIIVIDGGSRDRTRDLIAATLKQFPQSQLIDSRRERGPLSRVLLQWLYLIGARPEAMGWIYYSKSFKLRRRRTTTC